MRDWAFLFRDSGNEEFGRRAGRAGEGRGAERARHASRAGNAGDGGNGGHARNGGHGGCFGDSGHFHGAGRVTLDMAAAGESVRVVHVCGGHEVLHRLLDIGIVPGQLLRVIHNDPNGPLVVSVHNASMMINRGLAARIRIAEE